MTQNINERDEATVKGGGGNWNADISPIETDYASSLPNSFHNHMRSDLSIRDEILFQIDESVNQRDSQKIDVDVLGGEVFLSGFVTNLATRRAIENICDEVSGVNAINNSLKVSEPNLSMTSELHAIKVPNVSTPISKRPSATRKRHPDQTI